MLFNSIEFLLFFPAVTLVYYLIPGKLRLYWVLAVSYLFYMGWNAQYALLLLFSTAVTFAGGLLTGMAKNSKKHSTGKAKFCVAVIIIINAGILFFFKYFNFALDNLNPVLVRMGVDPVQPGFDVLLPVGISFYIFQALSYTMDVYRGDVRVEKNFFKYAAFVSFFPQLVAGPIERSSNLLGQFDEPHAFRFENVRDGLLMMLWGFFLKIVIADRAAIVVNQIFNYYTYYGGLTVVLGMVLFALQIYGDFAGYSCIAVGAGQVMGFTLMENFHRPYFAVSVADFWRRWHISLSTWFRDYLYIPLGGNRKGRVRRYVNQMIVMLVSGLWHGAEWTYIVWGGLNGALQVLGDILKPLRERIKAKTHMRTDTLSHHVLRSLITFVLIDITWVFFRANTITQALDMLRSVFTGLDTGIFYDGSIMQLGLDATGWTVLLVSIAILFGVSALQESGKRLRENLARQELWFQYITVLAAFFFVLLTGIYGPGFDSAAFIYFQF